MITEFSQFPTQPGVYLMQDRGGEILYIGKAKNLRTRVRQYFQPRHDGRAMIPYLTEKVAKIETIVVRTEKEALLLENTLIKKHQPKYNALLKDDKTFVSLMVNTHHRFPMLRIMRIKGKPKGKGEYFGPYTNAYAARQTYNLLLRLFPLRQCSDAELERRKRPCILYDIKKCVAPCVGKCTENEYAHLVKQVLTFLKGEDRSVLDALYKKMEKAAEEEEFEQAGEFLKTIRQIEHITQMKQGVVGISKKESDLFFLLRARDQIIVEKLLFRSGNLAGSAHFSFSNIWQEDEEILTSLLLQEYARSCEVDKIVTSVPLDFKLLSEVLSEKFKRKITVAKAHSKAEKEMLILAEKNGKAQLKQGEQTEELLLKLEEELKLTRYPHTIVCFDTSNIAGTDIVAASTTFVEGKRDSKKQRTYKIKSVDVGDDYGAMREVLSRYLKKADPLPDLILLDGGKGQLSSARSVFKELGIASIDLVAIAKEEARHDKGIRNEKLFLPDQKDPLFLPPTSPLLFFLQRVRDESHRVAISFHKKRRQKRMLSSSLDTIPGIGKTKRARLLAHFGSVKRIREASSDALKEVHGITQKDIATLKKYL